jgi:hypothetical protein
MTKIDHYEIAERWLVGDISILKITRTTNRTVMQTITYCQTKNEQKCLDLVSQIGIRGRQISFDKCHPQNMRRFIPMSDRQCINHVTKLMNALADSKTNLVIHE